MTISITCIDALTYDKTIKALSKTLETLRGKVDCVYWFSDIEFPGECEVPVFSTKINKFTNYIVDYNYVALKVIPEVVQTDHTIIIHDDGFAVNAEAWTDEFLECDYIGARWIRYESNKVGNGGFCLRSKKLFNAIKSMNISHDLVYGSFLDSQNLLVDNTWPSRTIAEDTIICRLYGDILTEKFDIKFASPELADRFSIEDEWTSPWCGKSLGFHGRHGVANYYGIQL
jgi:hypothetical protein